jgi:hypothetical protein
MRNGRAGKLLLRWQSFRATFIIVISAAVTSCYGMLQDQTCPVPIRTGQSEAKGASAKGALQIFDAGESFRNLSVRNADSKVCCMSVTPGSMDPNGLAYGCEHGRSLPALTHTVRDCSTVHAKSGRVQPDARRCAEQDVRSAS